MIYLSYNQVRRILYYVCQRFFGGDIKETIYWLKSEVGVPDSVVLLTDEKGRAKYVSPYDVDTIGYGLMHELWDKFCDCDYSKLHALLRDLDIYDPRIVSNFKCYNPDTHTEKNVVEAITLTNKCNKGRLPKYTVHKASKTRNVVQLTDGKLVSYNDVIDAVLENRVYITNFSALNLQGIK